jgi:two-component system sensor histidine kinase MprB
VTFRTRVAAAIGVVVAVAVMLACFFAYRSARDALEGSADSSLHSAYEAIHSAPGYPNPYVALYGSPIPVMLVLSDGETPGGGSFVPVDSTILQVAKGRSAAVYRTVTNRTGYALRELIVPLPEGIFVNDPPSFQSALPTTGALVLVEPFQGIEDRLASLREQLLLLAALGILVAALFGWVATRAALVPLRHTTSEIEDITDTLDVSHRFEEGLDDELGRLRRAFNRLLAEVERSQVAQRQLIMDASHELRTPLTSLRANAQVLGRLPELDADDVAQLSGDMVTQVDELTRLVAQLTELTQGERSVEEPTTFDLADLVGECAEIAETFARTKSVTVEVTLEPSPVHARRNRLARAVGNLLDNAIKFSPEAGTVTLACRHGAVTVEDGGPGIDDEDLGHVFDRFYRSPRARGLPGSGLGLAIVAQVAAEAGGTVAAGRSASLGGASLVLTLRTAPDAGFSPLS